MKRLLLLVLLVLALPAHAAKTQEVFKRFQDRIVQIRILESSSGSRVALGSGFSVSRDGEIVTNYHVVSELVQKPQQYRADQPNDRCFVGEYADDIGPALHLLVQPFQRVCAV